ncbi:MAG: bifunctional 2-C-methyl-D-erythritol 4-phosphate cytidylyltransferase/2-C-methyl-D-erythritol 2,4-cyclodiphosphate synthase, partial [Azorhizobium sp. 12-66-6]
MHCAVIVVAAGRGTRAAGAVPKQYQRIDGETVLRRSLMRFAAHPEVDAIQVVIHPDDSHRYADASADLPKLLPPVAGGNDRQDSVRAGLAALLPADPELVLVHDAARPFPSSTLISQAIAAAARHGAAVPGLPV